MSRDPARCPICGHDNHCGLSAGRDDCWCFDEKIAETSLAQIPEDAKGVACVCRSCALGEPDFEHAQEELQDPPSCAEAKTSRSRPVR